MTDLGPGATSGLLAMVMQSRHRLQCETSDSGMPIEKTYLRVSGMICPLGSPPSARRGGCALNSTQPRRFKF